MKAFMLGWEFPPFISGGLGTACYGLTKAMAHCGIEITFVLPKANPASLSSHLKMLGAEGWTHFKHIKFRTIASPLTPYVTSGTYDPQQELLKSMQKNPHLYSRSYLGGCAQFGCVQNYTTDMYEQVQRYAEKVSKIADTEEFDIIHAHDWMTYPAAITVAQSSHKPLLVQIHSTEFDRSGENVNQMIYDIERQGMHAAYKVIAVSNYTKNIIVNRYAVPPEKVEVVYNGVEHNCPTSLQNLPEKTDKIVLFLGRITMQKGPEYFIAAAKKVLEKIKNVKFIMAGNGDMMRRMIEYAAYAGIGHKVFFTGFLKGDDIQKVYQMADLLVMPSVSEPFGIAPLEALQNKVPVLVSKQSGIAEVLTNALKVDFWDINEMTNKIVAVLKYPALHRTLSDNGHSEAHKFQWENSAAKINEIYNRTLACA